MTAISGLARELACLALRHDDSTARECRATDEQLMRQLIAEVRHLRQCIGEEPDRAAQENALAVAMTEVAIAEPPDEDQPGAILDMLWEGGWTVSRLAPHRTN